jgi:esterase
MSAVVALALRDLGGEGPPMLVLHGLLGSARNWLSTGVALAANGWHVYAADLRNHGVSGWADDSSYQAMAGDVVSLIEQQGWKSVYLVGHSMGGKVAMRVAMNRPDLVLRLAVVDIAPKVYTHRVREEFTAMEALDLTQIHSRKEADLALAKSVSDWAMRQFILTNLQSLADGSWQWLVNRKALTAALPEIMGNPLVQGETYNGPACFICGGKSGYVGEGDWPTIKTFFPAAQRVVLPESGHNPHFDSRGGFVEALGRP